MHDVSSETVKLLHDVSLQYCMVYQQQNKTDPLCVMELLQGNCFVEADLFGINGVEWLA